MGYGEIISGGDDGLYTVKLILGDSRLETFKSSLEKAINEITDKIQAEEAKEHPNKQTLYVLKIQKTSLEKRKKLYDDVETERTVSAWCADYTTDMSAGDKVGTIEIPDDPAKDVMIQPGYEGNAAFNPTRDGQVNPVLNMGPASVFFNRAIMPGVKKWKPGFRYGTITTIDGDTCNITLEESKDANGLSINQTETLTGIEFNYMSCNALAFKAGDKVLVSFERDWKAPKVIGFKYNPKPCTEYLYLNLKNDAYGLNKSCVWDIPNGKMATDIPDGEGSFVTMPCSDSDLQYWLSKSKNATVVGYWDEHTMKIDTFNDPPAWQQMVYSEYYDSIIDEQWSPPNLESSYVRSGSYSMETENDWLGSYEKHEILHSVTTSQAYCTRQTPFEPYPLFYGGCSFTPQIPGLPQFHAAIKKVNTLDAVWDERTWLENEVDHFGDLNFSKNGSGTVNLVTPLGTVLMGETSSIAEAHKSWNSVAETGEESGSGSSVNAIDAEGSFEICHSEKSMFQLYIGQLATLSRTVDPHYAYFTWGGTGQEVLSETYNPCQQTVICGVGVAESSLVEDQYDPSQGSRVSELEQFVQSCINTIYANGAIAKDSVDLGITAQIRV